MRTPVVDFLEAAWLGRAREASGRSVPEEALERLRPAVRRLSDLFTTARPDGGFPDYFSDPGLLAAYGLFFFPQSFARAGMALDQPVRFRGWRPAPRAEAEPVRVLDIGGGPGPCGLAMAAAIHAITPGRGVALTLLDHSAAALAAARELVAHGAKAGDPPGDVPDIFRSISLGTICADAGKATSLPDPLPLQDVIVAGFCANELVPGGKDSLARWLAGLREKLAPEGLLLVLEPALRETALRLRHAADVLVAEGLFHEWAPGIGAGRHAIPPPGTLDSRFHPHEVRAWTPPDSMAFLNRELFRESGSVLKFSYVALGAEPPPLDSPEELLRLVSPLEMLKGRLVCAAEDENRERLTLEIPTRGLSKNEVKKITAAHERGDIFRVPTSLRQPVGLPGSRLFRIGSHTLLQPAYTLGSRHP
jgi:hypothetical protein